MEEREGIALEIEASDGLTEAEVIAKAVAAKALFAVIAEQGRPLGVLAVSDLSASSRPVYEAAQATPTIAEQTVPVTLPDGAEIKVEVAVQGSDLALWKRGPKHLVMPLAERSVAEAVSHRVMAAAIGDIELPNPTTTPPPKINHTYVCPEGHYEQRTSEDQNRVCKQCGRKLFRV